MILIKNLYLKFIREYFALYDINMEIKKGEKVCFVGSEDSGKTTLIRVLAKLEKFTKGEVYIKDIPLAKISYKTDLSVGYVPVKPIYLKKKTVYQNFVYLLKERNLSEKEIEEAINKVLIDFNIEKFKDEIFENLSLYEQYLISFARIALRKIDLLLVDNVFDKLNKKELLSVKEIIKEHFLSNKNLTSIIATSNNQLADELSEEKFFFRFGSKVENLTDEQSE